MYPRKEHVKNARENIEICLWGLVLLQEKDCAKKKGGVSRGEDGARGGERRWGL